MDEAKYMDSSEIPTFLNEMAMRFPEKSRERIGLIECSIYISIVRNVLAKYISIVRNVLAKSRQKEPVVGIKWTKGEPVPCVEFQR